MISSRATAASACRAVLPPPGADVFPLRSRAVGRHRKIKLGDWRQPWLRVAGALLLVVSACIHLDLYLTGYRSIPTIGWLFLVQFRGRVRPRHRRAGHAQQAGRRRGCRVRAVHPGLLPAGGLDRVVRVQGDPNEGGDRRWPDRGGRLRDAGAGGGDRRRAAGGPARPGQDPGCWPGCGPRSRWWSAWSVPSRSPPWSCSASRWPARAGAGSPRAPRVPGSPSRRPRSAVSPS